ncbi:hypothetical protein SCHPADRAFT_128215 [Schizopora paradoxa]|uniref:Uncharacterized protein n=1 Tax=Schizopora paradoxa TaxID=27342 RepID=A0A0H2S991_9AGAM|nr:hypothetical protein SCHPADRAFT_128215 [Schizopora paradoxa]
MITFALHVAITSAVLPFHYTLLMDFFCCIPFVTDFVIPSINTFDDFINILIRNDTFDAFIVQMGGLVQRVLQQGQSLYITTMEDRKRTTI